MLIAGHNGAGKTNLLEAIHFATQGFSPRTRTDAQLIRFGESAASIAVAVGETGAEHRLEMHVAPGSGKRAVLDGAAVESIETVRRRFPALVFTPDRLSVIKGGPAIRRAYFDRALARLYPARADLPSAYADIISQRNAALRRVQLGLATADAVAPWTAQAAELGAELVETRRELIDALAAGFRARLSEFGLPGGAIGYVGEPPSVTLLENRLAGDIATATTGIGPHRDDVLMTIGGHDLRSFGSQGQQRLALLSLLLTEATLAPAAPVLLLDDVLSELDGRRRAVLAEHVSALDQTLVTTTHGSMLPVDPSQLVEVTPGQAG